MFRKMVRLRGINVGRRQVRLGIFPWKGAKGGGAWFHVEHVRRTCLRLSPRVPRETQTYGSVSRGTHPHDATTSLFRLLRARFGAIARFADGGGLLTTLQSCLGGRPTETWLRLYSLY